MDLPGHPLAMTVLTTPDRADVCGLVPRGRVRQPLRRGMEQRLRATRQDGDPPTA